MSEETRKEGQFSEDLDRLLGKREITPAEERGEDYQTALNFARKIIDLRDEPSSVFKDRLKQRLLLQLTEQEAGKTRGEEEGDWFRRALRSVFTPHPAWRAAAATATVAVLIVVVLWGTGMFEQVPQGEDVAQPQTEAAAAPPKADLGEPPVRMMTVPAEGAAIPGVLEMVAAEMSMTTPVGGEITIELTFRNTLSEPVRVAPFPPALQIVRAENGETVRSLAEGSEALEIPPSGARNFSLVWDQFDDDGAQAGPGSYVLVAGDVIIYKETEPQELHQSFEHLTDIVIQSR